MLRILVIFACGCLVVYGRPPFQKEESRPPFQRDEAATSERDEESKDRSDILSMLARDLLAVREIEENRLENAAAENIDDPEKEIITEENELTDGTRVDGGVIDQGDLIIDENDPPEEALIEDDEHLSGTVLDGGVVYQGDMVIDQDDYEAINSDPNDETSTYKRQLVRNKNRRWPGGVIPYKFVSSSGKSALTDAMAEWSKFTCVKFVPHSNQRDYVKFVDGGTGKCFSHVGRTGGPQELSLGFGCRSKGVAMHELGHALGLHHEQARPDRDKYVTINWDNIKSGRKKDFQKYDNNVIDDGNSPYDYDSIMHYSATHFNNAFFGSSVTIQTPNGQKIGQRDHLSVQDIKQIRRAYNC